MSKKTLNKANLVQLGADRLADLVLELAEGSASLKRQARMALSAAQGSKDIAVDIRKRFVSLRRATSYVDWRKQRALVKDLSGLLSMIETHVVQDDPNEAFELLWSFLQLAPSFHERTDDSNGSIGDVMGYAVELISKVAPSIEQDPKLLAERILEAVADAGYGEFDGIIPATADALGQDGLEHLKQITEAWAELPPTEAEIARFEGYGLSRSPEEIVRDNKRSTRSIILADVADAQGDVDAYMARYTAEQLTYGTIAPDVARRLLDANRVEEALEIITRSRSAEGKKTFQLHNYALDGVYEECLKRLGQHEELKQHLWAKFEYILSEDALRQYLKLLPDFDDMEAEERALDYAEQYKHLSTAITFLVGWPALDRAAKIIEQRASEIDGNSYYTLTDAAASLEAKHPMAATLLRRAMVVDALDGGKSKRYRYAAQHLAECQTADAAIEDYGDHPSHETFVAKLREKHGRKYGFWELVNG